ncbi:SDR family NAD(P)-dependent oxidoreductase [Nocardioides alcanivorans]|uniref:SDR family NAD(P)-dependent oxidoreductase n=1 Tax=Nocardioides alcanivorans TaxID=2897352 RepID=UPI001F425989|nr:SDR family NAD(P)-dependent oxidoreductase [Nocardioides alcanivorans]
MDEHKPLRVVVTGAGSGLGAALADAWEARGARVLATDRDPAGLSLRRYADTHDITDPADWARIKGRVVEQWGGLDVLVNNAGVPGGGRLDVAEVEEWRWIFEINLFGMVTGLREFTPVFKEQRSGQIINVASLAGLVHPAGMASYNAVKAAVVALTETAGHELAGHGVKAAVVCPSYFRTNLMDRMQGADSGLAEVMRGLVSGAPLGADEIAQAVLEGVERGDEVIIPDPAARDAVRLKQQDRAGYDAVMRRQAAKLHEL